MSDGWSWGGCLIYIGHGLGNIAMRCLRYHAVFLAFFFFGSSVALDQQFLSEKEQTFFLADQSVSETSHLQTQFYH